MHGMMGSSAMPLETWHAMCLCYQNVNNNKN